MLLTQVDSPGHVQCLRCPWEQDPSPASGPSRFQCPRGWFPQAGASSGLPSAFAVLTEARSQSHPWRKRRKAQHTGFLFKKKRQGWKGKYRFFSVSKEPATHKKNMFKEKSEAGFVQKMLLIPTVISRPIGSHWIREAKSWRYPLVN